MYNKCSMNIIQLCFGLHLSNYGSTIPENIKEMYQQKYKKIISFICAHQNIRISLFIPGVILEWLKKSHPEFLTVLAEKANDGQIEILSGGFYEPILPLVIPSDRVAQIEKLTTTIRKLTGKKPRGAFLHESFWDPSLISTFNTSAMEYTFLDYRLIPQRRSQPLATFTPHIVEDLGRTISIIPTHQEYLPISEITASEYIKKIQSIKENTEAKIISGFFDIDDFICLIETDWFSDLEKQLEQFDSIEFTLPNTFLKNYSSRQKSYIPAGCRPEVAAWAIEPCIQQNNILKLANYPTARDFISVYNESFILYSRLVHTTMLVNQCRDDKLRKAAAREHLYKAQHYSAYIFTGFGGVRDKNLLAEAYKNLLEAEKLYRESTKFTNNTNSVDFTHDGSKEYLSFFEMFNAFITLKGGMIFELDVLKNSTNYTLASRRKEKKETIQDLYQKKLFVDHIIPSHELKSLIHTGTSSISPLPNVEYVETSFNRHKSTLSLQAKMLFGKEKIPVRIRKNYTINENGILVQYIVKNEGCRPVKATFVIENNISFSVGDSESVKAEILTPNYSKEPISDKECFFENDVSLVRLEDVCDNVSFIFDVNEDCSFGMNPYFSSHTNPFNIIQKQYEAHSCYFSWNIDLQPEYETEKNISLTIKSGRKKLLAKKSKK